MKKIKVLTSIVLSIVLIASVFAGCTKQISLEGVWITKSPDMGKQILEESKDEEDKLLTEAFADFNVPLEATIVYTFDENNAYTVEIDENQFRTDADKFMEEFINRFVDYTYALAEADGLSKEDLDKYYEESENTTVRDALVKNLTPDKMIKEMLDELKSGFAQLEKQNTIIKDDRFYITDESGNKTGYETFTLEGDTLTITGSYDMNDVPLEDEDGLYPLVLVKQAAEQQE